MTTYQQNKKKNTMNNTVSMNFTSEGNLCFQKMNSYMEQGQAPASLKSLVLQ